MNPTIPTETETRVMRSKKSGNYGEIVMTVNGVSKKESTQDVDQNHGISSQAVSHNPPFPPLMVLPVL